MKSVKHDVDVLESTSSLQERLDKSVSQVSKSGCVLKHPNGKNKSCAVAEIGGVKAVWTGQFMCGDLKQYCL